MNPPVADVTLPLITDPRSAEWAIRLVGVIAGDVPEPRYDLDLVERIVQAIRNEANRNLCIDVNRHHLSPSEEQEAVLVSLAREGFIEP